MSGRGERQQIPRRSSFRRSLAEASLPQEYLEQLEEKRRQLDESIHRYIAAKEREYKNFEAEVRQKHRIAQGQNALDGVIRRRSSAENVVGSEEHAESSKSATTAARAEKNRSSGERGGDTGDQLDRTVIAGLKDRETTVEREKEFVGLFTPAYLPAIDSRDHADLQRVSSAASAVAPIAEPEIELGHLGRANSDTVVQAKPKRPSHLVAAQRTSSSGSSVDGKLTSAMKSPGQAMARRDRSSKRVSLAVGDVIVAPSDNVPAVPTTSNTPSHSRQRSAGSSRELSLLNKENIYSSDEALLAVLSRRETPERLAMMDATAAVPSLSPRTSELSAARARDVIPMTPPANKLDPDGDLFDLEVVEGSSFEHSDTGELENAFESDDDDDDDDDVNNTALSPESDDVPGSFMIAADEVRYDSTAGIIPEPKDGKDSAVPYLAIGPGSSVSSQQPTKPGFRRPSVVDDPIYRGPNHTAAEEDAVEHDIYGSSFNRPPSKGSFAGASLGESYMAAHAEEMMRLRNARQQKVES